jgi:hypothetical protein
MRIANTGVGRGRAAVVGGERVADGHAAEVTGGFLADAR